MILNIGDKVMYNNIQGSVTRLHVLGIRNGCEVRFNNGKKHVFLGAKVNELVKV